MATFLASRAAAPPATNLTLSLCRSSFSFVNHFSSASPPSSDNCNSNTGDGSSASKKPKRRKKKNLIEVAQFLPNWGIGYHMAKSHWTNVSYQITKINLYKDGRHGKAWGIAFNDGLQTADAPTKISGVHKRCWRYIPSLTKSILDSPKPAETEPKTEVQAA